MTSMNRPIKINSPYYLACPTSSRESYIAAINRAIAYRAASMMRGNSIHSTVSTTCRMLMRSEAKVAIVFLKAYYESTKTPSQFIHD